VIFCTLRSKIKQAYGGRTRATPVWLFYLYTVRTTEHCVQLLKQTPVTVPHNRTGSLLDADSNKLLTNFSDFEKSRNFTNGADVIRVVTVVLEENNGHAGTNHHLSIFMKSCFEGNGTHLPRRVGVCVCVCEWVIGTRIAVR